MNGQAAMAPEPSNAAQSLREVRRGVAQACDAQVLQVVRMVDALEHRGASDAVLEPVRARLRVIQPARPLRFARLLFMPLDPLIVAPKGWRPGSPFLPRTALMVLSRAVRTSMTAARHGAALTSIDRVIEGAMTTDVPVVRQAGRLLWPLAAIALSALGAAADAACLADWAGEGLAAAELQPLATTLAIILRHAQALHDHDHGGVLLAEPALLEMLATAEPAGPRAWSMMLSLLMIRAPQSASALLKAAQANRAFRSQAEAASETALAWVETETADQATSIADSAPEEIGRQAALLEALGDHGDPIRRRRVIDAKAHLLSGSLKRLESSLHDNIATPLQALPPDNAGRDMALDSLEATARTLRRFEIEARRLGSGVKFDALAENIAVLVNEADGLCKMDRARLLEIIAGTGAATKLLAK